MGPVILERHADSRTGHCAVSSGTFQCVEPRELQHAQSGRVYSVRSFSNSRRDHQHLHHIPSDSVRSQAALVMEAVGIRHIRKRQVARLRCASPLGMTILF